jgi:multisubunit Na+/H+ antiporter MnhE subunit
VPNTPTNKPRYAGVSWTCGTNVFVTTFDHSTRATNSTTTYVNSDMQRYLKIRAIVANEPETTTTLITTPAMSAHTHTGPACNRFIPS